MKTLREILNYIDFDYEIENGEIKLIDNQQAYLGDIADFRVPATNDSIKDIIERTEIYWLDYEVRPLMEDMGVSEELENDWTKLYELAARYYGDEEVDDNTILGYLINPDQIVLD